MNELQKPSNCGTLQKSVVRLSARDAMLLSKRLKADCKNCGMDGHSCNYCIVTRFLDDIASISRIGKADKCQCGYPLESTVEILTGQCEGCINIDIERERVKREMRVI